MLLLVAAMLNPLLGLTRGLAPEIKASVFTDMQRVLADDGQTEQIVAAGSNLGPNSCRQTSRKPSNIANIITCLQSFTLSSKGHHQIAHTYGYADNEKKE